MFYNIELKHDVKLHPRYFGDNIKVNIKRKLYEEVEGTCQGSYGFIIMITCIKQINGGMLELQTGLALFEVRYQAIVMRPIKGEILEAVVLRVLKVGLFAEVGPLNIFVSKYSIPPSMSFCENPPCYKSQLDDYMISPNNRLRIKLVGLRNDANQMFAIGTLLDDYLGVIG